MSGLRCRKIARRCERVADAQECRRSRKVLYQLYGVDIDEFNVLIDGSKEVGTDHLRDYTKSLPKMVHLQPQLATSSPCLQCVLNGMFLQCPMHKGGRGYQVPANASATARRSVAGSTMTSSRKEKNWLRLELEHAEHKDRL